jgi:hypothetical protein
MNPNTAKLYQKMHLLIELIKYIVDYAYKHNLHDLINDINVRLDEITTED